MTQDTKMQMILQGTCTGLQACINLLNSLVALFRHEGGADATIGKVFML